MAHKSTLISGPLQVERLKDGERRLIRELKVLVEGETITVPAGFTTDYSSYPRAILVILLTVFALTGGYSPLIFLSLLLIPKYSKVDVAGVVHDYLYYKGSHTKWQADKIWLHVATSGNHRAYPWQAIVGWLVGLVFAGWYAWWQHRRNDKNN